MIKLKHTDAEVKRLEKDGKAKAEEEIRVYKDRMVEVVVLVDDNTRCLAELEALLATWPPSTPAPAPPPTLTATLIPHSDSATDVFVDFSALEGLG